MKGNGYGKKGVMGFAVGGVSLSPDTPSEEACNIVAAELGRAGLNPARLRFDICKRSVDARKKKDVRLVYSVAVRCKDENDRIPDRVLKGLKRQITVINSSEPAVKKGEQRADCPPTVVGMGPAGLFAALMLAENGYRPIIIDRGDGIKERCRRADIFFDSGRLDPESNIQFGAGGAGTFSDGKLVTRVNDERLNYILRRFCDFGAPEDILVSAKPHIGTDLLVGIVDSMLERIEELGGKIIYRCRLEGIEELSDGNVRLRTSRGDILSSAVVLATGHSARDVYGMLMSDGYAVEPKPFSVGVRIEHLQDDIDRALLGDFAGHPALGKGEYHLSDTSSGRGVYTFCMCPGGQVVAAASELGGVVVNGMSKRARDGRNANSAVLVSVRPEDIGGGCAHAIEFQRRLERAAFEAGGSDYYAPFQTVGDFLEGVSKSEPTRIEPTYRDGKVKAARLDRLLPEFVTKELEQGLRSFDGKINGFACPDAILTGVETRSSAPVRILRGEKLFALGHDRIYPCGEGAGYAGGISSAALDGVRVALAVMERFDVCAQSATKENMR